MTLGEKEAEVIFFGELWLESIFCSPSSRIRSSGINSGCEELTFGKKYEFVEKKLEWHKLQRYLILPTHNIAANVETQLEFLLKISMYQWIWSNQALKCSILLSEEIDS